MSVLSVVEDANFPSIYESRWFTRMWIVQEALLASRLTLYFAVDMLDWADFERVMILIHTVNAAIKLPIPVKTPSSNMRGVWWKSEIIGVTYLTDISIKCRRLLII